MTFQQEYVAEVVHSLGIGIGRLPGRCGMESSDFTVKKNEDLMGM